MNNKEKKFTKDKKKVNNKNNNNNNNNNDNNDNNNDNNDIIDISYNNYELKNNNLYYLNKMVDNWNKFRDYDIEVLGDRSLYFNYKQEIEEMIKEDEYINYEINNKYENLSEEESYFSE